MKIKLLGSYRSKKGNLTFRYAVSGTKEQLEAFAKAQGEFHRVDEATGTPLWFTTNFAGNTGSLIITQNGKVVADMTEFEKANSLAKQFGGNLGQELARHAAATLMGGPSNAGSSVEASSSADISQL